MSSDGSLRGRRWLVVEDDYMVATDLAQELRDRGAEVVGPAGSVEAALALVAAEPRIDGAVLDINLRGDKVYPVAEALLARGVRFVFITGYDAWLVPEPFASVPRLDKPVDIRTLVQVMTAA